MTKQPSSESALAESLEQRRLLERQVADEAARTAEAEALAEQGVTALGADAVAQIAERATQVMGGFAEGMLVTARQVARSAQQIQGLVSVSNNLRALLGEVEGAADQTALLSLNTSLEAARAGQAERMRGLICEIALVSGDVCNELGLAAERSLEESCRAQAEINYLRHLAQSGDASGQNALSVQGGKSRVVGVLRKFQ